MKKAEWINMGYQQVSSTDEESMDTLTKRFENGNIWIVQFNEEHSEHEVGKVYLKSDQVNEILGGIE